MIENKRCPWCGHALKHDSNSFKIDQYAIKCSNCHNWSRPRMNIIVLILPLLLGVIGILWNYLKAPFVTFWSISLILLVYIYKLPYKRISNGKWDKRLGEDVYIGVAQISWLSKQEGGLFLAKHMILNHYIMPICFCDDENNPVTHTFCVRLERNDIKKENYKIFALNDNINIDIINNKKFYIFNNKRKIAEGRLV